MSRNRTVAPNSTFISLLRRVPAINSHRRPCHETRHRTRQKHNRIRNLLHLRQPLLRNLLNLRLHRLHSLPTTKKCQQTPLPSHLWKTTLTAELPNNGVLTYPGQTALILTPSPAYLTASVLVNPTTACLLAVYAHAGVAGELATSPNMDATFTITPLHPLGGGIKGSWESICRICARWQSQTPVWFTSITRCQSEREVSWEWYPPPPIPALLTAMSMREKVEIVSLIAEVMDGSEEVSVSSSRIERSL